ncbi:MAG: leucine-rich repeat domain-containing protein, partial [Bacteroidaceae bacterium]|nr:leucine-rich repeat domain-containing protein [Bacteroidaceae bacterium]
YGCTGLTSIEIPNSVTSIGNSAFYNCSGLTSIEIPNSVTSIEGNAFYGCTGLTSIEIPNSVTSIEGNAFSGCTGITNIVVESGNPKYDSRDNCNAIIETATNRIVRVCRTTTIPNSVTSIGSHAFSGCTGLTEISIPDNITDIESFAFEGCSGLTSIEIPNSVTSIGSGAFADCSALESIIVENGNTIYDSRNNCNAIIETATNTLIQGAKTTIIPKSVTSIENYAFYGCSGLAGELVIPNNVTRIGHNAFNDCSGLTSVVIGDGVNDIKYNTFSNCTNLSKVILGNNIRNIEGHSFYNCAISEVISKATLAPNLVDYAFDSHYLFEENKITLIFPEGANYLSWIKLKLFSSPNIEYYKEPDYGDGYIEWFADKYNGNAVAIGYGGAKMTEIPYYLDVEITKLHIEGDVTEINTCPSGAEEVSMPNTVLKIGDYAFYGCYKLKNLQLSRNLTSIGEYAFFDVPLEYVVIPSQVTWIDYNAFGGSWYDPENDVYYGCFPVLVFKSFVAPNIAGFDNAPNIYVPAGANSYPSGIFGNINYYESQQECCIEWDWDNGEGYEMFIFGNVDNIYANSININIDEIYKVILTPDAPGYNLISLLPNVKYVDVLTSYHENGSLYSMDASNAVFQYRESEPDEKILVAGCATTVIPEGTTAIEDNAFNSCIWLEDIKIPSSVKRIGNCAFYGCSGLTNVTIPYGVENFSGEVFANCTGLKSVVINGKIGDRTFHSCDALTDVTVGKMASDINGDDFYGCTALTNITVDKECLLYDDRDNCNAIIEKASNKLLLASKKTVIPKSVTSISGDAFHAHADMDLTVPETVKSIDTYAFNGVSRLYFESETPAAINGNIFGWGAIYVPESAYDTYCNANVWSNYKSRIVTTEIANKSVEVYSTEGMSGVLNAIGLNEVDKVVRLKVKGEINSYDITVFRDKMPLLNELDLSEATVIASSKPFYKTYCTGNNSLGGYAFYDLDKLISVTLPKGLKIFGDYAFYNCEKLTTVDASHTDEISIGTGAFEICSKLENFVSPQKINNINGDAFHSCKKLENIELRKISGSIGENAFFGANIKNVDIDSIGGNIETYAFKECANLQNVRVGTMTGNLGNNAFAYCASLKNVEFGKGPARIGSEVFEVSDSLVSFVAGEGVSEVADNAFMACVYVKNIWGALQKVTIPRPELKKVVLPNGVQRIGKEAFYQCTSLSDFAIPQNAVNIGESAFSGCSSLQSVNIPEGTTSIKSYAFNGCSSLKNITFPSGLTSIGDKAFYDCAFENLKLPPVLKTIGEYAFGSCDNLTELHIPSAVENIENGAFAYCFKLNDIYTYTVEPTVITESTFSTFGTARLHVPGTSFWNYYWDIGWSRFNHKFFVDFNKPYDYFYLNNDYYMNGETGYIEGNPNADMRPNSGLIVKGDEYDGEDAKQNLGDVNVESDGEGNSASIIGDENLHIDNLHVKINVKGGRWYFFAFPWDVKLDRISMQNGSYYVFRHYDGDERAKKGKGGWKDVKESHLKAARGYIFQCSADDVLVLSIEDVKFKKEDKYNELVTHVSENLNDASWNLMGNPYLSYYDMADMNYTAPVTVWDGSKYVAVRPGDDDYQFAPYEAFFVQKPEGQENVVFGADGQLTKTQAETEKAQKVAARRTRGIDLQRLLVNLVLSDGEASDRARVVFNNRQTHNYEVACDAAKFETAGQPQIYTIDDEGVRYAINERPVGNGVVFIGYAAPAVGYYTIEAPRMDTKVFLYDAETGEKHYFEDGAYSFYSAKGTFEERFSLGIRDDATTGVEGIDEDEANGENGNAESVYDLHGRKLKRADKGIFIINGEKVVK